MGGLQALIKAVGIFPKCATAYFSLSSRICSLFKSPPANPDGVMDPLRYALDHFVRCRAVLVLAWSITLLTLLSQSSLSIVKFHRKLPFKFFLKKSRKPLLYPLQILLFKAGFKCGETKEKRKVHLGMLVVFNWIFVIFVFYGPTTAMATLPPSKQYVFCLPTCKN